MRKFRAIAPTQAQVDSKARDQWHDWDEGADQIARMETTALIKKAVSRKIALPPKVEGVLWQRSSFDNSWYLTYDGQIDIRTRLRVEAKEKTELLRLWLPSAIAAIGAVGAWIAALKK